MQCQLLSAGTYYYISCAVRVSIALRDGNHDRRLPKILDSSYGHSETTCV